ncbi:facilitated trehalose transporter Tret1-like [Scaptodrosophila lebanonensis]|uniref:Facilitated trehalose transporter Tret1-like n=1 Tax=Drosophila lebanonensis TaxID=7225 RepID=A0A6J2U8R2_DROLE|nr:facilitated trehalose transporter Tret1-like [Scaptodrosophila lebanonensis]
MLRHLLQRPNCLLSSRNRFQFLTTLLVSLLPIAHGIGLGWLSPTLRKLQSPEQTPLSFAVDIYEVSWIGSAIGLGSILGTILTASFLERLGHKIRLLLVGLPHTCFWVLIFFAPTVEYLYAARFLAGVSSGGMFIVHPIFISEIADSRIRGSLSAMVMLSINLGILSGYIIGTHVPYHIIPAIVIFIPLTYLISSLFIPETPQYLIKQGKYAEAEKSFRYYKNLKVSKNFIASGSSVSEFDDLKIALTHKQSSEEEKLAFKDFVSRPAVKAYGVAVVLILANQFSGTFAFVNYMSNIFAQSGTSMDPDTCSIVIGVVQICGTYVTTLLCDSYGRKKLMLVSSAGVALCLTAFGLFTHYSQIYDLNRFSWLPLVLMSLDIFLGNIGLVGCFYMLLVEVFPAKIRSRATSAAILLSSGIIFLMLNIFPICMSKWGISITMWSCASFTAASFVFFWYFLEETRGKSMLEN